MDDEVLVQRAVAGDRESFGALFDRYGTPLHDFLHRMLGDPHDAADALQETFLSAGSRLHQLRDPSKVRAWLYAIARRQAYRTGERRGRSRPIEEADVTSSDPDPTDDVARAELAELIDDAAAGLDHRDRAVLHLHFRHGLEGQELADALGVERGHAHVLVHRLGGRLERSLGALLVARHGDCEELTALLGGWDGTLTTALRKRLARHVDGCAACAETRRRQLRPAALLGAVPVLAAPADARERLLDRVELCSHTGAAWAAERGGFPPTERSPRVRRRVAAVAVVVVVLFSAVGIAGGIGRRGNDPVPDDPSGAEPAADTTPTTREQTATSDTTGPVGPNPDEVTPDNGSPESTPGSAASGNVPATTPDRSSAPTTPPPAPSTTRPPSTSTSAPAPTTSTTTTTTRPTTTTTTTRPTTTTTTTRPTTTTTTSRPPPTTSTTTTAPRRTTTTTTIGPNEPR